MELQAASQLESSQSVLQEVKNERDKLLKVL